MKSYFEQIDHLMFGAFDVERASEEWRRLGFNVGPLTTLPAMGFCNRRVLFRQTASFAANFIEVLQLTRPVSDVHRVLRHLNPGLERREQGANAVIFATHSADQARAYYEDVGATEPATGLTPEPIMVGDYPSVGPDGEPIQVRFRNCLLPNLQMPVPVSLSQIQAWDFYQNEAWLQHDNAARSMIAVTIVTDTLDADVARYEWLLGRSCVRQGEEVAHLEPGDSRLTFMTKAAFERHFGVVAPMRAAPFIAAMTLTSNSFERSREVLSRSGAPLLDQGTRLIVGPMLENAIVLEFLA
ncbi:VOC family protein [Steroidobacter sp.]|uniref:VOC family protein n=1 Tax=Steroidobacter sp. TaxID=1978227 RepID=UPI001A589795|nr:VOC family protein [Steroidobacter sp.]MBL8270297.1 VOC family protein [Steroidobacter sp.]